MKKELGSFNSYKEVMDFFPRSVWEINSRTKEIKELFEDDLVKHTCERTSEGIPVSIKQNFSVFNPLLGINILKIWSNVGDWVIDPFCGRDRPLITNYMERNYIGYEISPQTYNQVVDKIKNWRSFNDKYACDIVLGDGTDINSDRLFDFCYTCPPYWFKEKYESVEGQLSDIKTEKEWLDSINRCGCSLLSVLKPHAYAVVVIADIRDKGRLIPLHSQWIDEFLKVGFSLKDIVINRTNPMNVSGVNGYLRHRIMQKSHEYVLVFECH